MCCWSNQNSRGGGELVIDPGFRASLAHPKIRHFVSGKKSPHAQEKS